MSELVFDYLKEPTFNPFTIQKRIDEFNREISAIRQNAFSPEGVDVIDLQVKIVLRDSLIENLKTIELSKKDVL
jgi:hypothetical protein